MKTNKYQEIEKIFSLRANEKKAIEMSRYMKNRFVFYGIQTPKRKAIYKDFLKKQNGKNISIGIFWMNATVMNIGNFNIWFSIT